MIKKIIHATFSSSIMFCCVSLHAYTINWRAYEKIHYLTFFFFKSLLDNDIETQKFDWLVAIKFDQPIA